MSTYCINSLSYCSTLAEALLAAGANGEITCSSFGTHLWTESTDERGSLWLSAAQCADLDAADLIALINSQPECDEFSLSELIRRAGLDPDDYDNIGILYEDARLFARSLGCTLCHGDSCNGLLSASLWSDESRNLYRAVRCDEDGSIMLETEGDPVCYDSQDELEEDNPSLSLEGGWYHLFCTEEDWEHRYGTGIAQWMHERFHADEQPLWYAVMRDDEDDDWGTGSPYMGAALAMARRLREDGESSAYVAVIDNGTCISDLRG